MMLKVDHCASGQDENGAMVIKLFRTIYSRSYKINVSVDYFSCHTPAPNVLHHSKRVLHLSFL